MRSPVPNRLIGLCITRGYKFATIRKVTAADSPGRIKRGL